MKHVIGSACVASFGSILAAVQSDTIVSEKTLLPAGVVIGALLWAVNTAIKWTRSEVERENRLKRLEEEVARLKSHKEDQHETCSSCGEHRGHCNCD
jgi:mannitol-specific phosphotransferase system IIBC component